jgi:hypothetical protein
MDYSNYNEIWGIKPKPLKKNKEQFSYKSECENFNHILSCEKCLKKINEKMNNKKILSKIESLENQINLLKNKKSTEHFNIDFIDKFKDIYRKNKIFFKIISILLFLILSILLIRPSKNIQMNNLQKHFIMVPRDMFTFSNLQ